MDPWTQRLSDLGVVEKIKSLLIRFDGLDLSQYTNEERSYLDRTREVAEVCLSRLTDSDPRLLNITSLTNINNSFANVNSYLENWLAESGDIYLHSHIQNELDTIIAQSITLSFALDMPAARENITTLRRTVARHRTVVDQLVERVKEKGSLADQTIDKKLELAKEQFAVLDTDVSDLESKLEKVKITSGEFAAEQQIAFTKAETDRAASFNTLLSDKQKDIEASVKEYENTFKQEVGNIHKKISEDETAVKEAKLRVEEILGIVGEESLIGDYSNNAKDEKSAANFWRWVAAGSLAIAIVVAIWFSFTIDENTVWQKMIAKVVIVISFGGLAGYAARQSSEHRTAQREAEQMALQLKALKPYLNDISDKNQRDTLLAQIAEKLFGQKRQPKNTKKNSDAEINPLLVDTIYEILKHRKDT